MSGIDYLSAVLRLTESRTGETTELHVAPQFDEPLMDISIVDDPANETDIVLNRRQIECLTDFLVAWLARLK